MTNKLEQDKKIIADAPEGAMCHVSFVQPQNNTYSKKWGGESVFWDSIIKDWTRDGWGGRTSKGNFRSIEDIRENIALQERVAELDEANATLHKLMVSGEKRGVEKATKDYEKRIAELEEYRDFVLRVTKAHDCECITDLAVKCEQQDKRIAELRHENLILKAHYCLDRISGNIDKIMLDKMQAKRDLGQQAKGIEDLIVWFEENCNKWGLAHSLENIAPNYAKKLREQAKQLKGEE